MAGFGSDEKTISLGGNTYLLAWTMGSRRRLLTHTGKGVSELAAELDKEDADPDIINAFLWSCLLRHNRDIAYDEVVDMTDDLTPIDFQAVTARVIECMSAAAGEQSANPIPPQKAGKNGPSKRRSSST
jgi:hypothetical protein